MCVLPEAHLIILSETGSWGNPDNLYEAPQFSHKQNLPLNLKCGIVFVMEEPADKREVPEPKSHAEVSGKLKAAGLEVLTVLDGNVDRPTAGKGKPYVGISPDYQTELGIEKPSNHVVAVIEPGSNTPRFYLLSGLIDDEEFLARARKGVYSDYQLDEDGAREVADQNPMGKYSMSAPSFSRDSVGRPLQGGIVDLEKMRGRVVRTRLRVLPRTEYRSDLQDQWRQQTGLRPDFFLVLPNPILHMLGITLTQSTHKIERLGTTIAEPDTCNVIIDEFSVSKAVAGALDGIGLPPDLLQDLDIGEGEEIELSITVGKKILEIRKIGAVDDARAERGQDVAGVLEEGTK